jgi:methylated-DNA-[protein]-cysteine S-methyltransferase
MTHFDDDELTARLAGLATDAPAHLLDRVAARWLRMPGPLGDLYVASTDHGIAYLRTADAAGDEAGFIASFRHRFGRPLLPSATPAPDLLHALESGRTDGLRFDLRGSSEFARAVLGAVSTIPRGEVRPYAWIAREIGRPAAVRAVGTALNHNPVPLLIPCHRVIRSDGVTGEYVFGPVVKRRLLETEGVDLRELR